MTIDGTTGDDDLDGTTGDDDFDLSQGGEDIAHGLAGADHFYFGKRFSAGDHVFGGGGFDDVALSGGYGALTFNSGNISGIEGLSVGGQFNYNITFEDSAVAAGTHFFFYAAFVFGDHRVIFDGSAETNGSFDLAGSPGNDRLVAGAGAGDDFIDGQEGDDVILPGFGADEIYGGVAGGADRVIFVGDGALDAADRVYGGNTDVIELSGDYSGGLLIAKTMAHSGTIKVDGGNDYNLTLAAATLGSGMPYIYDSSDLHANDALTLDAGAAKGGIVLYGGDGVDTVIGAKGYNSIHGRGGADILTANDRGPDVFNYEAASDSTSTHYDTVIAFDAAHDFFYPVLGGIDGHPASFSKHVHGTVNAASFDTDLANEMDATMLDADSAALYTAKHGDLAGVWFVIIDGNSTAGYQANQDVVVRMDAPTHLSTFDIDNFGTAG